MAFPKPSRISTFLFISFAIFLTLSAAAVAGEEEGKGTVAGRIACPSDQPCRGVASLWDASQGRMPDPRKFIIPPAVMTPLDSDGSFALQAPPGRYYLGAVLRRSDGPAMGPPRAGDRVYMTPGPTGSALLVEINAGERRDVGIQDGGWVYAGIQEPIATGILGRVADRDGGAVPGMLVFAFGNPEMAGRPLAVSEPSDVSGQFRLRMTGPGEVYLVARERYGAGAPCPGDRVGVFGGVAPASVRVEEGRVLQGLLIEVIRVPESAAPAERKLRR